MTDDADLIARMKPAEQLLWSAWMARTELLEQQLDEALGRLDDVRIAIIDEIADTEASRQTDAMLKHFIRIIDQKNAG